LENGFLSLVGLYGAVNGAIWLFFNATEHVLKAPDIKKIAGSLKGILEKETTQNPSWPEGIISLFDSLFIPKKRRENPSHVKPEWRRVRPGFFRSSLASIITVALLSFIYAFLHGPDSYIVFKLINRLLFIASVLNVVPDYFSIWETRFILSKIQRCSNVAGRILWLLLDGFFTFLLPFLVIGFIMYIFFAGTGEEIRFALLLSFGLGPGQMTFEGFLGIFIYSTFLTSVWIWLYMLAGFLIRLGIGVNVIRSLIMRLDLDQKPLSVMGWCLMVVISFSMAIVQVLNRLVL